MSGEWVQTLNLSIVSPVKICFTEWITYWRQKRFIFCMLASAHIWWTGMIPSLKPCTNSMDTISTDVQTVRKIRTIWVRRGKFTQRQRKYLHLKGYNMRIIWEHEFKLQEKSDVKLKQFIRQLQTPLYRQHCWMTKVSTILDAMLDNTFGFLEVDINVLDDLLTYFEEMSPPFSNTEVKFEDISCSSMSEITDCPINHVTSFSVAWELTKSCYLPPTWSGCCRKIVTKLHQVIEYTPQCCFKKFVLEVSDAHCRGCRQFSEYGCRHHETHRQFRLRFPHYGQDTLYTEGQGPVLLNINDQRFKKCTVITDNLYEMEKAKTKIRIDLPIQLGYHILQLAKLQMLQFRYDCLEEYCDVKDFEYLKMDTNSAYLSLASNPLENIVKQNKKQQLHYEKMGQCRDFDYTSEDGFFPCECCKKHKANDKRTPGLFKLEAQGKALIALCSKTYILKKLDDKVKFSSKELNKAILKELFPSYQHVLQTGQIKIVYKPKIQNPGQHHLHLPAQ